MNKELVKGSTAILVLSLLGNRDMYGYEIIQELKRRSNNVFSMKEGSLYPMLHSLENDGAVESYFYDTPEGRRRKYYRITDTGREMLKIKQKEWTVFSGMMNNILADLGGAACYE